ncbi:MAG: SUMF1/EgtB/PvdO family nonheme iron enzyme [Myxococcales bacterium]|nr:SUMF1/EgtB/PvdO family nonheme iron enzyme [Myxococcales bacterium]
MKPRWLILPVLLGFFHCSRQEISPEPQAGSPAGTSAGQQPSAGTSAGTTAENSVGTAGNSAGTSSGAAGESGQGGTSAAGASPAGASGHSGESSGGNASGTAGAAGESPGGVGGSAGQASLDGVCPEASALPGPLMVRLQTPDGVPYCMDSTEVTQAQYAAFLASPDLPTPGSEHKACKWNGVYYPNVGEGGCANEAFYTPEKTPDTSVGCIDWCDAYAYCKWAGKRLCGRVGGGVVNVGEENDANKSQWYNGCSQGGKSKYPYGDTYQGKACHGKDAVEGSTEEEKLAAVSKAKEGCAGEELPYSKLLDLSGNHWELEDACEGDLPSDGCRIRGGSYGSGEEQLRCGNTEGFFSRTGDYTPQLGFRCCLDL